MKINILIFDAVVFAVLACGCVQQDKESTPGNVSGNISESGFLEGMVSIGPICPVERINVTCKVPPEAYDARRILVYGKGKTEVFREVSINNDGSYRVVLVPGSYVIDINRIGMDRSPDVPKEIEIKFNETITLDISIDTGIR